MRCCWVATVGCVLVTFHIALSPLGRRTVGFLASWSYLTTPRQACGLQHAVLLVRDILMRFSNLSYRSLPRRPSDHRIFCEMEFSHHAPAGVQAYTIDPVASGGGFHLRYDGAVGVTLSDEPQLLESTGTALRRSSGTLWSMCSPSLTFPQWMNTLSLLDGGPFPMSGWRISSLATSSESPTPHSSAFRSTPCSTTADLPAFPPAHLR